MNNKEGNAWSTQKIRQIIWDSLLDYARIAWGKTLALVRKSSIEAQIQCTLRGFDANWLTKNLLGTRTELTVKWNLVPPRGVMLSWF